MKPKRFVHVGFNFEGTIPPIEGLQKTFNRAVDWVRYDPHCWILYTGVELDVWRDRIRQTSGITEAVTFFLMEFQGDYSGYMEEWVWKWLSKKRP